MIKKALSKITIPPLLIALRPNQWIKNLVLFTSIVFNGKLFDGSLFTLTLLGFAVFCALSSSSYLFNDIIDFPNDRNHPVKKNRPIAAGKVKFNTAVEIAFLLGLFGLLGALFLSTGFFLMAAAFIFLHIFYSLYLKKFAIWDIMGIAFSFMIRSYSGAILTGYHVPFWLFLTVLFVALFVAATKRHAELLREGVKTRPALFQYRENLLDFYTSTFSSASIIAYSLFTFLEEPPQFTRPFRQFLTSTLPGALDRKWMVITIPFIVFGLMRYAQLAYEGTNAEQPEKIITKDIPLIVSILLWGLLTILVLYIL